MGAGPAAKGGTASPSFDCVPFPSLEQVPGSAGESDAEMLNPFMNELDPPQPVPDRQPLDPPLALACLRDPEQAGARLEAIAYCQGLIIGLLGTNLRLKS